MLWGDEVGKLYFDYPYEWSGLSSEMYERINALPQEIRKAAEWRELLIMLYGGGGVDYFELIADEREFIANERGSLKANFPFQFGRNLLIHFQAASNAYSKAAKNKMAKAA